MRSVSATLFFNVFFREKSCQRSCNIINHNLFVYGWLFLNVVSVKYQTEPVLLGLLVSTLISDLKMIVWM